MAFRNEGGDIQTHRQQGDLLSFILCFEDKGSRIKRAFWSGVFKQEIK
jgi:hypothetical protein